MPVDAEIGGCAKQRARGGPLSPSARAFAILALTSRARARRRRPQDEPDLGDSEDETPPGIRALDDETDSDASCDVEDEWEEQAANRGCAEPCFDHPPSAPGSAPSPSRRARADAGDEGPRGFGDLPSEAEVETSSQSKSSDYGQLTTLGSETAWDPADDPAAPGAPGSAGGRRSRRFQWGPLACCVWCASARVRFPREDIELSAVARGHARAPPPAPLSKGTASARSPSSPTTRTRRAARRPSSCTARTGGTRS